jgi:YD repeat-containing protein
MFHRNVMARLDKLQVGNVAMMGLPGQLQNFTYDERDRLTRAWVSGGFDESFSYNAIGNLTSKAGVTLSDPASGASSVRPHAVTSDGTNSYSYDGNGNLTAGAGRSYGWTAQNRPSSVTGADGARVKKTRGVSTVYQAGGLISSSISPSVVGGTTASTAR